MNIVLVDTGPIVALLDRAQHQHHQCVEVLNAVREPLATCEAVLAEACYLVRKLKGATGDLLRDVGRGRYLVPYHLADRCVPVARLMAKYADTPMDLADACLVDLATELNTGRIITLDRDFSIYRWGRNRPFELLLGACGDQPE